MAHEWMIDVLADLRQYAIRNYCMELAEQLDDAIVVAAVELRRAPPSQADAPSEIAPRPLPSAGRSETELRPV